MRVLFAFTVLAIVAVVATWCLGEEPAVEAKPGIPIVTIIPVEEPPLKIKAQYWRSDGTAMFRDIGFDPAIGPWESELEYPLDGNYFIFGAEDKVVAVQGIFELRFPRADLRIESNVPEHSRSIRTPVLRLDF